MTHDQPGASTAQVRGDAGLRGLCARIDEGLPFLKYLGFSFWVAWFGVAYNSVCWLTPTETTSTAVNDMFVISTLAHVVTLLAFALLYRRASGIVRRRTFVLASALVACAGCACVLLAGPLYVHSRALFYVGSAFTGMGTATLCVNGGLLLCAHRPAAALRTLLSCELAACLIEYMVVGLPYVLSCAMFVAMPLLSALCYVVGNARPEPAAVAESSRLEPPREMWRLLVATFVLCFTARVAEGFFTPGKTPGELGAEGAVTTFLAVVCFVGVLIACAAARRSPSFAQLFYGMAGVILLALVTCCFVPSATSAGVIVAAVAFQLLDVAMWCACTLIVYQSKTSATLVVSGMRAVLSAGVAVGAWVGGALCSTFGTLTLPVVVAAVLVLANVACAAFVFPRRHMRRLVAAIPDEDDPSVTLAEEQGGSAAAPASDADLPTAGANSAAPVSAPTLSQAGTVAPASSVADEQSAASAHRGHGRWKALCLQMADEAGLTEREKEVFVLLAKGRGSQSISDALTISLYTTRAHTRNIYAKLDVHSRHELSERVEGYVEQHAQG